MSENITTHLTTCHYVPYKELPRYKCFLNKPDFGKPYHTTNITSQCPTVPEEFEYETTYSDIEQEQLLDTLPPLEIARKIQF